MGASGRQHVSAWVQRPEITSVLIVWIVDVVRIVIPRIDV